MKLRNMLTLLILAISLVIAPPAVAVEKPFTQEQVSEMVRSGLANDSGVGLIRQRGIDFTPTEGYLKSLKRQGAKEVFLKALLANAPLTQEQINHMVQANVGDESGAQMVTQRGVSFAPTEEYLQTLKSQGAKESFLKALRSKMPVSEVQILAQLAGGVPSPSVSAVVKDRGITFDVNENNLREVRAGGGDEDLVGALKSAKIMSLPRLDDATAAKQAEVLKHLVQGAELKQKGQFGAAELEFRAALSAGTPDPDVYVGLAAVLGAQGKWDDDAAAAREAVRLNPNNEWAYDRLGLALAGKGDWDGAAGEYRESLRLNKDNDFTHTILGAALGGKHDWDGEIAEEREALRLNPGNDLARAYLAEALVEKGDMDGAVTEYRDALRLNPNKDMAHVNLAWALEKKGDWDAAMAEYKEALRLNPSNARVHASLGAALGSRGDWNGAIVEYRQAVRLNPNSDMTHVGFGDALRSNGNWDEAAEEYHTALRLNPNNAPAHLGLGLVLGVRGDWDGAVAEEREAVKVEPNNPAMHASLGDALEQKSDRQGALAEYCAAAQLDVKNTNYKQNCERLSRDVHR